MSRSTPTPNSSTGSMGSSSYAAGGYRRPFSNPPMVLSIMKNKSGPSANGEEGQQKQSSQSSSSAILRRESMTKLQMLDDSSISFDISQADTSQISNKKVSFCASTSTSKTSQNSKGNGGRDGGIAEREQLQEYDDNANAVTPLPTCLAESQVVREKPTVQTRILVCLLSGCVIVFCLMKLFYWK